METDWTCAVCGEQHSFYDEGYYGPAISLCIGCGDAITKQEYNELVNAELNRRKLG